MKQTTTLFLLASFTIMLSGCVTRSYVDQPKNRGQTSGGKSYGSDPDGRVTGQKRIWFWQDEFRNP